MYKAKLWDEDKWDIHSSSYSHSGGSAFSDDKKYHEQKYGSKEKNSGSDYMRKEDRAEDENKEKDAIAEELEEKKDQSDLKEEDIPFKAAKQIFNENQQEPKKLDNKKNLKTIEEAIKKAIEDEKKVVVMDN